jgi:hypothetical protein
MGAWWHRGRKQRIKAWKTLRKRKCPRCGNKRDGSTTYCPPCQSILAKEVRYGLTEAQYQQLVKIQRNSCSICSWTPLIPGLGFVVDHDHNTGMIRGLLCQACNTGLGWAEKKGRFTENQQKYLQFPPFAALALV